MPRYGTAAELSAGERYCTCCGKKLVGRIRWLELDQRTQSYHDRGNVPVDQSQGWFPFGLTCAKNEVGHA